MATLVLHHSELSGSDRLGIVLQDHGHRLDVRRLHAGDAVPADLDGIDAVVSCGGAPSPMDDDLPWLEPEMALIRAANAVAMPVVGICLGNQIVARALGGTVEKMDGMEVGWHEVTLTPSGREDPLFAGHAWRSHQLCWHGFKVTTPPDGARVLAWTEQTPVQAWALGLRTYGFQYHFEAGADRAAAWADDAPDDLRSGKITRDELDGQSEAHTPTAARLSERLCEAIALVLMPLDRRYAGIAKDLHH